jgi:hypothetical protein
MPETSSYISVCYETQSVWVDKELHKSEILSL